jgi:hypothetical protein
MKSKGKSSAEKELSVRIKELIKLKGGGYNESEVADIIENALKLLTDVQDTIPAGSLRNCSCCGSKMRPVNPPSPR